MRKIQGEGDQAGPILQLLPGGYKARSGRPSLVTAQRGGGSPEQMPGVSAAKPGQVAGAAPAASDAPVRSPSRVPGPAEGLAGPALMVRFMGGAGGGRAGNSRQEALTAEGALDQACTF